MLAGGAHRQQKSGRVRVCVQEKKVKSEEGEEEGGCDRAIEEHTCMSARGRGSGGSVRVCNARTSTYMPAGVR